MNNNIVLFGLLGVGAYMLTRTKTSAPANPTRYTGGTTAPYLPPTAPVVATPGNIFTDVANTVTAATDVWGTIKGAVTSIKTSLPTSTPSSIPPSTPSVAVGGQTPPWAAQAPALTPKGIVAGDYYPNAPIFNSQPFPDETPGWAN